MKVLINEKLSQHKYKTPEGYLICVDSILARTGKQTYQRDEVFHDGDSSEIEVDRTFDEVFSPQTLASFENKPITVEHPDEDVNSENYKDYAVGFVRDVKQGKLGNEDVILGTLVITDAQTIQEIENGEHTDLSCGYDCDIIDEENPQQRNIRGNHVALCQQGRAGIARIVDSEKSDSINDENRNDLIKDEKGFAVIYEDDIEFFNNKNQAIKRAQELSKEYSGVEVRTYNDNDNEGYAANSILVWKDSVEDGKINFEMMVAKNDAREWLKEKGYYNEYISKDFFKKMNEVKFANLKGYGKDKKFERTYDFIKDEYYSKNGTNFEIKKKINNGELNWEIYYNDKFIQSCDEEDGGYKKVIDSFDIKDIVEYQVIDKKSKRRLDSFNRLVDAHDLINTLEKDSREAGKYEIEKVTKKKIDGKIYDSTKDSLIYKGYGIEENVYGKNEFSIQLDGDDVLFKSLDEAKKFIDDLIKQKDSVNDESILYMRYVSKLKHGDNSELLESARKEYEIHGKLSKTDYERLVRYAERLKDEKTNDEDYFNGNEIIRDSQKEKNRKLHKVVDLVKNYDSFVKKEKDKKVHKIIKIIKAKDAKKTGIHIIEYKDVDDNYIKETVKGSLEKLKERKEELEKHDCKIIKTRYWVNWIDSLEDAKVINEEDIDKANYVIGKNDVWFAKSKKDSSLLKVAYCSNDNGKTWYTCYLEKKSDAPSGRTQVGKLFFRTGSGFPGQRTSIGRNVLTWYTNNHIHRIDPSLEIDHINGDFTDDRLNNLERVTKSENIKRMQFALSKKR